MKTNSSKPSIVIMGAGLVGSLWAVLLRKRGFEVTVFEKRCDIRKTSNDSGRSINLIITSRGVKALQSAGLLKEALDLSVPVYGRMMHSRNGELTYQAYGQENERNLSISRTKLNQFLIQAAEKSGARIYFDHSLEHIDLNNKTLHFHNGETSSYNLLFGTDGAGSQVRKSLCQQKPDRFQEQTEWLNADYKELFLPQPNKLKLDALHIWPRGSFMMMALANLDGSFTVTLYLPKKGSKSFETIQSESEIQKLFEDEFPDAIELMPHFKSDFKSHPQGALGTIRCSHWTYENSVCLMGDAAHAIVPFFGQGMNSGFEDCTELLRIFDSQNENWDRTLEEFDRSQRPNANAIADMAIENWIEMSEKVADPRFLLRKKVESVLEKNFPDMFKSRYGMVTYTLIPYSQVKKAGQIQDKLFETICDGLNSVEQLNHSKAQKTLEEIYVPFLKENKIEIRRFDY